MSSAVVLVALAVVAIPARACTGDVDGDGRVDIAELITGVGAALGARPVSAARAFDADGDGHVRVNELIAAVANGLHGCPQPTPTATPIVGDRIRVFAIAAGDQRATPDTTRTGFFTSALESENAAAAIGGGPLVLQIGAAGANGVAPFWLREDTTLELTFLDDSCLCLTLLAATSAGTIDCDGGTAYDTRAVRPDAAPDFRWTTSGGLGEPAAGGNAALLVSGRFERVAMRCEAADCPHRGIGTPANDFAFTTTNAIAVQETSGPALMLTVAGEPFSCDHFTESGSGGMLTVPIPTTVAPIGDVANVLRLAEQP